VQLGGQVEGPEAGPQGGGVRPGREAGREQIGPGAGRVDGGPVRPEVRRRDQVERGRRADRAGPPQRLESAVEVRPGRGPVPRLAVDEAEVGEGPGDVQVAGGEGRLAQPQDLLQPGPYSPA